MSIKCEYHPDLDAVDKCERCNRKICLNDKKIHRIRRSSGTGSTRRSYSVKYTYCPICEAEARINGNTGGAKIFKLIFGLFFFSFAVFWTIMAGSAFPPMAIFGLIFIVVGGGILYDTIINGPKYVEDARRDEQEFINSLKALPEGIDKKREYSKYEAYKSYRQSSKVSLVELTCFECGSGIPSDSNFCMNCGSDTVAERDAANRKM